MFKNRVRTAALAGAIAVATGVSGLTVPAYAQDANGTTVNTGNHFNKPDASNPAAGTVHNPTDAVSVKATDVYETLEKQVDGVQEWIKDESEKGKVLDFIDYSQNFSQPERTRYDEAVARRDALTAELAIASQNLSDIQANIDIAAAQAKAADDAWRAYADSVALSYSDVKAINKFFKDLPSNRQLDSTKFHYAQAYDKEVTLNGQTATDPGKVQAGADRDVTITNIDIARVRLDDGTDINNSGVTTGSGNPILSEIAARSSEIAAANAKGTATADDLAELQSLAELDALVRSLISGNPTQLRAEAVRKTGEVQKRANLENLYYQALAQVHALRLWEAYYAVGARYLDLYENDTLRANEKDTLREDYLKLIDGRAEDLKRGPAGTSVVGLYQQSVNALATAGTWDALDETSVSKVAPSRDWENPVNRVRNLDLKYRTDAATAEAARKEAEEKARAEAEFRKSVQDALDAIAKAAAQKTDGATNNNGSTTNPGTNNKSSIKFKTEDGLAPAGIAAIVLGVVAALGGILAFAFPHVQNFLKF